MRKVSVIIPVYGVENYLPECLESVLHQSLQDIEVICVDDHSPDRCPEILDDYAQRDRRIKVIHLPKNGMQGHARNIGMDLASGTYIYFLDSDDAIRAGTLEKLYEAAERDALDGALFDSTVIFETSELEQRCRTWYTPVLKGSYPTEPSTGSTFYAIMMRNREWSPYIQRTFWRREYLQQKGLRFPEGIKHEDELFAMKAVLLAKRMRYLRETFFIRRFREGSDVTSPPAPKNFRGYFITCRLIDDFLREYKIDLPEAHRGLLALYDVLKKHYDLLCADHDLENLFARPEEKYSFRMFRLSFDMELMRLMGAEALQAAAEAEHIWICGNDYLCGRVYRSLVMAGYQPQGFLMEGKQEFYGKTVLSPDVFFRRPEAKEALIIKAFEPRYLMEAERILEKYDAKTVAYNE